MYKINKIYQNLLFFQIFIVNARPKDEKKNFIIFLIARRQNYNFFLLLEFDI